MRASCNGAPVASTAPAMNVLMVVPWDQPFGGVASVVGNLARSLEQAGHQVVFFHPGEPEYCRRRTTAWGFTGYERNLRSPFVEEPRDDATYRRQALVIDGDVRPGDSGSCVQQPDGELIGMVFSRISTIFMVPCLSAAGGSRDG